MTVRETEPTPAEAPRREREKPERVNEVDTRQLFDTIDAIKGDPSLAECRFYATTRWKRGTVSETEISRYALGGKEIPQRYSLVIDEPNELLGTDTAPNPQMVLYAALNACVLNTFVVNASARGIRLRSVEMETEGELDLRGFLAIDESVNPGYDELTIRVRVDADAPREQLQECLDAGTRYSPNFQSISRPVRVRYALEMK